MSDDPKDVYHLHITFIRPKDDLKYEKREVIVLLLKEGGNTINLMCFYILINLTIQFDSKYIEIILHCLSKFP